MIEKNKINHTNLNVSPYFIKRKSYTKIEYYYDLDYFI